MLLWKMLAEKLRKNSFVGKVVGRFGIYCSPGRTFEDFAGSILSLEDHDSTEKVTTERMLKNGHKYYTVR